MRILILLLISFSLQAKPHAKREVSIIYNGSYMPSQIVAFEGEELILHYANLSFDPTCLFSGDLKLFISSYQFNVSTTVLKNLLPGLYNLSCPGVEHQGSAPVLKIISKIDETLAEDKSAQGVSRNPASVDNHKVFDRSNEEWVPRDEDESELFYHGDL